MTLHAPDAALSIPPRDALHLRAGLRRTSTFWWWLPLLIAALAGGITYTLSENQADVYAASATLLAPPERAAAVETYAGLATTTEILREVIRATRLPITVEALQRSVRTEVRGDLMEVTVRASTAAGAQFLAQTLANVLVRDTPTLLGGAPQPTILSTPITPAGRVEPDPAPDTAIAVALGLVGGILLAAALAMRERPVQHPLEIQQLAGLTTYGIIPRRGPREPEPAMRARPRSEEAEAIRLLREAVEEARQARPFHTLLIAGVEPGAGATSVAANLALSMAHTGHTVLLVDADLRRPRLHQVLGLPNDMGFADLLSDAVLPIEEMLTAVPESSVRMIATGMLPPSPADLLATPRTAALLERLRAAADLVILDAPPVSTAADAAILARACDAVLLVVDAARTRAAPLQEARLALAGSPLLGAVLTHAPAHAADARYQGYFDASRSLPSATAPPHLPASPPPSPTPALTTEAPPRARHDPAEAAAGERIAGDTGKTDGDRAGG